MSIVRTGCPNDRPGTVFLNDRPGTVFLTLKILVLALEQSKRGAVGCGNMHSASSF
jgi:hypothetical protein